MEDSYLPHPLHRNQPMMASACTGKWKVPLSHATRSLRQELPDRVRDAENACTKVMRLCFDELIRMTADLSNENILAGNKMGCESCKWKKMPSLSSVDRMTRFRYE